MRVLLWYCTRFAWTPTRKTLENVADGQAGEGDNAVVAFVHAEPADEQNAGKVETKLVKNMKWLAGKWDTKTLVLHSFTHLGEDKAGADFTRGLFDRARTRLEGAGYHVLETPYGHFNDLDLQAPGHPLARVFKQL